MDMKTREMLLKAKIFRMFAVVFAVVGFIIFIILYAQNVEGTFLSAMTNPFVVTIIIVPFLPAIVLSWLAKRLESKARTPDKGK